MDMERMIQEAFDNGYLRGYEKGKADRPSGEVDAVKEYEHQVHNLDQGYITLGEFDKRIEPLRHLHYDKPRGEWIEQEDDYHHYWECSECGMGVGLDDIRNFCPNCGAHMKGADDERKDIQSTDE